jgi:hypothetical protein
VVDAMRAVDPKIVPIAVGAVGDWTKEMLTRSAAHMELLSEHTYWQDKPDVPAHVEQAVVAIRKIADAHRAYRRELPSLKGKDIRIALDEWNYWYGPNEYGELGTRYFLQDGLGAAGDQDDADRGGDGDDRPRPAALLRALRHDADRGRGRPPAAGRGGCAQRGRPRAHPRRRQSHRRDTPIAAEGRRRGARRLQKWVITGKDRWAHNRPGASRGVDITTEAVEGVQEAADVGP